MASSSPATHRPMAIKVRPRPRLTWPGRVVLLGGVSLVLVCILLALVLIR